MTQARPGWYPDPHDPSRNLYWDGFSWHPNFPPPAAPPPPVIINRQSSGCMTTLLIGLALLLGSCVFVGVLGAVNSQDDGDNKASSSSTSRAAAAPAPATTRVPSSTPASTVDTRPPPTNEQVRQAFQAYIDERAGAGVMLAQAVESVTVAGGVVTVTLDASDALLSVSPFDNLAEFFGTPVVFNSDQGIWLRRTVQRVDVVNSDGTSLGSMTSAELNKKATGR